MLDGQKPKLLEQLRNEIKRRNYSIRTERAYADWVKRFIFYHDKRHPKDMGAPEVQEFLTYLAVERNVSASTQNQALCALVFLYRQILNMELGILDNLQRAKRPALVPVVLTREEVKALMAHLAGSHWMRAQLMYGSGMRLMECVRLRVKDIDFGYKEITVRQGKGHKDRYTLLSQSALDVLRDYWRAYRPSAWLFYGRDPELPLSSASAQQVYYQALAKSGVRRVGGIHTLRHCFATHLMENGLDIYALQRLMGHSGIKTTCTYMHVREERLRQTVSPLDLLYR